MQANEQINTHGYAQSYEEANRMHREYRDDEASLCTGLSGGLPVM